MFKGNEYTSKGNNSNIFPSLLFAELLLKERIWAHILPFQVNDWTVDSAIFDKAGNFCDLLLLVSCDGHKVLPVHWA